MKAVMGKTWVMERHVSKWPNAVKPIPGFPGYFMLITPKKFHTTFDAVECGAVCQPGANIVTTSQHDTLVTLKPWRCKKGGKEYGAEWVSMQRPSGKRQYFKLEKLALELFGEKWLQVKAKMSLEDLF